MAPKGGRGGRRNNLPMSREVQISKKLSWLLRHGAQEEGLKLGEGGYIDLEAVLSNRKVRNLQVTLPEVKSIVAADEKQRFSLIAKVGSLNPTSSIDRTTSSNQNRAESNVQTQAVATSTEPSDLLIRANQGHSMKVSDEGLLIPLTTESKDLPRIFVHGTRKQLWQQILRSGGLRPMTRQHIHFATGVPAQLCATFKLPQGETNNSAGEGKANGKKAVPEEAETTEVAALPDKKDAPIVLSGMRNTSTLLIFLDFKRALENGLKFFMSENGVVLCAGNEKGVVPVEFFERVVETGGGILVKDGKVL